LYHYYVQSKVQQKQLKRMFKLNDKMKKAQTMQSVKPLKGSVES
jgi:uncharacterized protein YktA (UPF0223 family)